MSKSVQEMLAREAAEAESVADAEDRGEVAEKPGQRARQPSERSQVYSLRLPASAITHLRALAEREDEPPTALLRRFVLERLTYEMRRSEPVDVVASAVDDLMPLVRQRLLEAAHEVRAPEAVAASALMAAMPAAARAEAVHTVVNVGPSRRKRVTNERGTKVSA